MAGNEGKSGHHYWEAIAAGGTALAALVALATYLWPSPSNPQTPPPPQTTTSSALSVATPPAGTTAPGSPTPSPTQATVFTQAVLRMDQSASLNVDSKPLTVEEDGDSLASLNIYLDTIQSGGVHQNLVAPWPGPGQPTPVGCEQLLQTQAAFSVKINPGLVFCTVGIDTPCHVAFGDVLSYDGTVAQIKMTVWNAEMC